MQKKAFSLIEIIVVLGIILLLFLLSVPKISFINKFILQNEADKVHTVLNYLKEKAITSNQEQDLIFDLKENGYSYKTFNSQDNTSGNNIFVKFPEKVKIGFLPGSKGPPSDPTKPINNPITFEKINENQYKVHFFVDGKIKPGTLYIVDKDLKYMYCLTCPISQVSYIRKYQYDNGVWVCLN